MPLSDEQRRLQSERIRHHKPWLRSTGPRTHEGKKRSSKNAFKGGERPKLRAIAAALRCIEDTHAQPAKKPGDTDFVRAKSALASPSVLLDSFTSSG